MLKKTIRISRGNSVKRNPWNAEMIKMKKIEKNKLVFTKIREEKKPK